MKAREIVGRWRPTYIDNQTVEIYRTEDGKIEVELRKSLRRWFVAAVVLAIGAICVLALR